MAIVEKYERVIAYLYPIAQSMPRKHGVAREMFLQCLLGIPDLLFQAGKSNQVSKIYAADAGLAQVRFWLRFLLSIRAMTTHQRQSLSPRGRVMQSGPTLITFLTGWRNIMASLSKTVINTRADLDAIAGTPEHAEFMSFLKGSMTRKQDTAVRPENYGKPEYEGEVIAPIWKDVEDLSTIKMFGFTKKDFTDM